ncbi:MAG: hypothetical protein HYU36_11665 [Planctomycetes bacterium]|nr:hypothetical protein [Planctomycetota bacterium]
MRTKFEIHAPVFALCLAVPAWISAYEKSAAPPSEAEAALLKVMEKCPESEKSVLEDVLERVRSHRNALTEAEKGINAQDAEEIDDAIRSVTKASEKHSKKLRKAMDRLPEQSGRAVQQALEESQRQASKSLDALRTARSVAQRRVEAEDASRLARQHVSLWERTRRLLVTSPPQRDDRILRGAERSTVVIQRIEPVSPEPTPAPRPEVQPVPRPEPAPVPAP